MNHDPQDADQLPGAPADDRTEDTHVVNAFYTQVERDDRGWIVTAAADGARRVVSRHATEEAARFAHREMNASANRNPGAPPS